MIREDVLKVEFMEVFDGKYAAKITYQDTNILERGEFYDKEIGVKSAMLPDLNGDRLTMYIMGTIDERDSEISIVSHEEKRKIEHKVSLINEKYGKVKLWRAKKSKDFYYVYVGNGKVKAAITQDCYNSIDDKKYEIGNYFETEEEAEKYVEKIKNMFKERLNG